MRIAVIPARGGSKRIPRKNIKDFCGKPIIAYTIEALQQSGVVDRIWVSTDDEEIAEVAKSFGAEIPFLRPKELSDDMTRTVPVIAHAVRVMMDHGLAPTAVCCAYATAPMIQANDLKAALEKLLSRNWEFVIPAVRFSYPIWRSFSVDDQDRLVTFYPEKIKFRSQDLPTAWHDAGQFYWASADVWLQTLPIGDMLSTKNSTVLELPTWRVADIDNEEDWSRAELLYKLQVRKTDQ